MTDTVWGSPSPQEQQASGLLQIVRLLRDTELKDVTEIVFTLHQKRLGVFCIVFLFSWLQVGASSEIASVFLHCLNISFRARTVV